VEGALYVAYCARCHAEYYPDRITYHADENSPGRIQKLEYGATYLRVSKHGIWMDRRIAVAQENAILRFHSGWSNFAEWLNDTISVSPRVTTRQSQRLYFEHFARRLISAHDLEDTFSVPAHSSANALVEAVHTAVGEDGGVVAGAMKHGCTRCTHLKRYTADLLAEGAVLDENESGVVDAPPVQVSLQLLLPVSNINYLISGKCSRSQCTGRSHSTRAYSSSKATGTSTKLSAGVHTSGGNGRQNYLPSRM
jgi:hypothetical protein